MRIRRTVPPAAAPLSALDLIHAVIGMLRPRRYLNTIENEFRGYFDARRVWLVSSGKAALFLILEALKALSPKREVVIPAYTCFSVPSAVVRAGLQIRLCDVDPDTFDFDHEQLARTVDDRTLCVIPTHLLGVPADVDRVLRVCAEPGAFVVEDAAQAMGGRRNGKLLGTSGDAGFFSFGRGKNITSGSGGLAITRSKDIADAVEAVYATFAPPTARETVTDLLRVLAMSVCIRPSLYWLPASLPFLRLGETIFHRDFPVRQFSGMKAGLLRSWRHRLDVSNEMRARSGAYFNRQLNGGGFAETRVSYLRFPLLAEGRSQRDRTYASLRRVGVGLLYPTAIEDIRELGLVSDNRSFPSARRIAESLVTLPTHPLVSARDLSTITGHVRRGLHDQLHVG